MEIVQAISSNDNATKYMLRIGNGTLIEAVYVNYFNKHIICFSSQAGCTVGCIFCVSGLRNPEKARLRSLDRDELIDQCESVVLNRSLRKTDKPILFSCMGEGEPLLNYKNVVAALCELGKKYGNSRLALSTSGIRPDLIKALAHENFTRPFKLQVSIHAPNDEIRKTLMPVSKPLAEIVDSIKYYKAATKQPIDLNYLLFEGINDADSCAEELAKILSPGWHVKFNSYNPIKGCSAKPSTKERLAKFTSILEANGITTETYKTNGSEIMAACGQLTYKFEAKAAK